MYLQAVGSKHPRQVPFPKGFGSVLDYSIAPDDHAIAVSFGAAACDYPGDVARVYLISLPDMTLKPLTPGNRLSVKAHWTPDSRFVIYSDYTGGISPLIVTDPLTGKSALLTDSSNDGPDEVLGFYQR